MTTVALIQARMGSTRLPGKVLVDLGGRPVLEWVVRAARAVPGLDRVAVATSSAPSDDAIAEWCDSNDVACHRGAEDDVLARFAMAAKAENGDTVMRLTADCPLLDPQVCGEVLALLRRTRAAYASNVDPAEWPDGLDCEVFSRQALESAEREATSVTDREHVTTFIRAHRHRFPSESLRCPLPGLSDARWTLDTPEDLAFLRSLVETLPPDRPPSYLDVLGALENLPQPRSHNAGIGRNEGYARTRACEKSNALRSYAESQRLLNRALGVIPLGSQTFSKSHTQFPEGAAPSFLSHGNGGRVWDVDGNEYVDLVCGLGPIILGYRDPDVDRAVTRQLNCGTTLSLASELETELAERLTQIIPCAEMVRFGKNGSDATTGCVRVARAVTGRDHIIVGGYHGWQDWYVGATSRNKGIPRAYGELVHRVAYNDCDAVHDVFRGHPGEVAALILEPMTGEEPYPGYLAELVEIAHAEGALVIFDEVVTGFRYALGGAQEYFGVTPDLSAFGKAMGNGMPISAVVGKAEYMREMEEIFFSSTFGGEALSLAAAITVIDKMKREHVIDRLWETGRQFAERAHASIEAHGLGQVLTVHGLAPWTLLGFHDDNRARKEAVKTLFLREMLGQGVLIGGSHNVCFAHDASDVETIGRAYDVALERVAAELDSGQLEENLGCAPIMPVFSVRPAPKR